MSETQLLASVRERLALERGVILWRNNTGKLQDARGRWVTYGIGVGGADLVGIVTIRSDHSSDPATVFGPTFMVGRFFALECKVGRGLPTPEQDAWARVVRAHGGYCTTIRSVEEAVSALARCRRGDVE